MSKTSSTKPAVSALTNSFQLLRKTNPPQALIHIGAGMGAGELVDWRLWDVPQVWIIDANAERLAWAEALANANANYHVKCAALAESDGTGVFYHANNPDEHGLTPPEQLKTIWPNLRTVNEEPRQVYSLDSLLRDAGASAPASWLFIDCLPAVSILKGAATSLQDCSVICARVLLQPEGDNDEAGLVKLESLLRPMRFLHLSSVEGNHPAVGHALFVRDWRAVLKPQLQQLTRAHEHQSTLIAELQVQVGQLNAARDEQVELAARRLADAEDAKSREEGLATRLASERAAVEELSAGKADLEANQVRLLEQVAELQQEREVLQERCNQMHQELIRITQAHDEQIKRGYDQQIEIEQLKKALNEQVKLASDHKVQLEQMTRVRDEQAKLAAERQQQFDALEKQHDEMAQVVAKADQAEKRHVELQHELSALTGEMTKLRAELEKANAAVKDRDSKMKILQDEMAERDSRQQKLNEEMVRAEAQIDLIKDVLLREPGI